MVPGYLSGLDLADLAVLASVMICGASMAFGAARLLAGTPAASSLEDLGVDLDTLTDEMILALSMTWPGAVTRSAWAVLN